MKGPHFAAGTQIIMFSIAAGRVMIVVMGGRSVFTETSSAGQDAGTIKHIRANQIFLIIRDLSMGGEGSHFPGVSHADAINRYR